MFKDSFLLQCSDTVGWQQEGIWPVKSWVLVWWCWWFDWSFAHLTAAVVTTTSITLSSNKIQNGDILESAYLGSTGKWPFNKCHHLAMFNASEALNWQTVYDLKIKLFICPSSHASIVASKQFTDWGEVVITTW